MCIEDIYIGRATVDTTKSTKQVLTSETFNEVQSLVIPANQYRTGLRIWGQVILLGDSPELPQDRSNGWIEVWVDDPTDANQPVTFPPDEPFIFTMINAFLPTVLIRIKDEGLLVQRRLVMRPAQLDTFTPTDVIINMGYTEYVFPDFTKYLAKDWSKLK